MCINSDSYEVVGRTEDGLEILAAKPQPLTAGNYLSAAIIIILLASAAYSIVLVLLGGYKLAFIKNKSIRSLGKKQVIRGVIIFTVTFFTWLLINLLFAFFSIDTLSLCL